MLLSKNLKQEKDYLRKQYVKAFLIPNYFNSYTEHFYLIKEKELTPQDEKFDRAKLEDLLKRRFFFVPSFEIYGGKNYFQFHFSVVLSILQLKVAYPSWVGIK